MEPGKTSGKDRHFNPILGIIETKIKFPSSDMLQKLALALRVDPAELFHREIDPETMRKNAQKAVIEDFGEAFCAMINDFVAEKIRKLDEETGDDGT